MPAPSTAPVAAVPVAAAVSSTSAAQPAPAFKPKLQPQRPLATNSSHTPPPERAKILKRGIQLLAPLLL